MSLPSKTVNVLGVTGSIGCSAADIIKAHSARFHVGVITGGSNADKLARMAVELNANMAVIADEDHADTLSSLLEGSGIKTAAGQGAISDYAAQSADITISAITGMAGLEPLLAAISASKVVAIANKEPLVGAGSLVLGAAKENNCQILPIDSEHNAVFQVLDPAQKAAIERIVLTASGGPFRTSSIEEMAAASPEQALAHPTWNMGRKTSIDSATMMNKALEIIEAHYLFDMPAEKIDVLVHPQSIIHSMVEYADGSVLAQMGASDMRTPITYALGWPERLQTPGERLDIMALSRLEFEAPDRQRFPAIDLAYRALRGGQGACIAMNAANEIAVQAFLDRQIGFADICEIVARAMDEAQKGAFETLDSIIEYDKAVRMQAAAYISEYTSTTQVTISS